MQRRAFLHRCFVSSLLFGTTGAAVTATEENSFDAPDIDDNDRMHLRRAITLSDRAPLPAYGENYPFGAVLKLGDGSIHEGWNQADSGNNPIWHAELWLISNTIENLNLDWQGDDEGLLKGATLYASTEPCAMCAGAVYWSGIRRIVYGCSAQCFTDVFRQLLPEETDLGLPISSREVLSSSGRSMEIAGPFLQEEARRVHERHWPGILGVRSPFSHPNGS